MKDSEATKNLPDIILADLAAAEVLLVIVEVVVTDGAITSGRKQALQDLVENAGFDTRHVTFVTAFTDRGASAYRKLCSDLAWGSCVWFESEPECIMLLNDARTSEGKTLLDWN